MFKAGKLMSKDIGVKARSISLLCLALSFLSCAQFSVSDETAPVGAFLNARPIGIEDLLGLRDITVQAVSPDGRFIAYQVRQADVSANRYDISWFVTPSRLDSQPVLVGEPVRGALGRNHYGAGMGLYRGAVSWSPDSSFFVYSQKSEGEIQLWRSVPGRSGRDRLTQNPSDILQHKFLDEQTLLYAVGPSREQIKELQARGLRAGFLIEEPPTYSVERGLYWPVCLRAIEQRSEAAPEDTSCRETIWAFDFVSGSERLATENEVSAFYSDRESTKTNTKACEPTPDNEISEQCLKSGIARVFFENIDQDTYKGPFPPKRVTAEFEGTQYTCNLTECLSTRSGGIWWNETQQEVIFQVRDGEGLTINSIYAWRPGAKTVRNVFSSDDYISNCTLSSDRLICGYETWTAPKRIVQIDLRDGRVATIVDENPRFASRVTPFIEKIVTTDSEGFPAHAHLVYPYDYDESKTYPLVIVQYVSRGFLRGGVGDEFPIFPLARNGFFVLSFNTPDGDYMQLEGDRLRLQIEYFNYLFIDQQPVRTLENLIDGLVSRRLVDSSSIGISGISHGASVLETALLRRNYGAASAPYSWTAPPGYVVPSDTRGGMALNGTFGGPPFSEEGFRNRAQASVGYNASRINTPFLLQVADREFFLTSQNYNALRSAGKPIELHVFPDEYHVKWQPAHRYNVYRRNLQWFLFWLKGEEVEDPVDSGQYRRWRKLRDEHCANMKAEKKNMPTYCH